MAIARTTLAAVAARLEALVPDHDPARRFNRVDAWLEFNDAPGTAPIFRHFILKWADGMEQDQSFEDCSPVLRFRKALSLAIIYHVPNRLPSGDILGIIEDDLDLIANDLRAYRAGTVISDSTGDVINLRIGEDRAVEPLASGDYLVLTTSIEVIYGRRF